MAFCPEGNMGRLDGGGRGRVDKDCRVGEERDLHLIGVRNLDSGVHLSPVLAGGFFTTSATWEALPASD